MDVFFLVGIGIGILIVVIAHIVAKSLLACPQITLTEPDISDIKEGEKDQNIDVTELNCPDCNSTRIKCNDNTGPFAEHMEDQLEARGAEIYNHSYMCLRCGKQFTSTKRLVKADDGPTVRDYEDSDTLWSDD